MDKPTEEYYNNYFMLFNQEGWKELLEDFSNRAKIINQVEYTKDGDDLFFRKGQLSAIATLLNWEESVRQSYELEVEQDADI